MNIKAMNEKRADLQARMEELVATAETETRAMNEAEIAEFDKIENEIRSIDSTIERAEKTAKMESRTSDAVVEDRAADEERAFVDYVMGRVSEMRTSEQNMSYANNGAIIPTTIANRIIKSVKEHCPIFAGATMYAVKGTLKIPVWGPKTVEGTEHNINVAYGADFSELTADSGAFTSVDLGGYLAGALTLIGRTLETNGVFDVTAFIVNEMGEKIAHFLEKELLNGTENKATGALSTTNTLLAGSTTAITFDNLIALQAKVPTVYQPGCCWTMAPETFTAIKELKDGSGKYILNMDPANTAFPYTILGKPVYLSAYMPAIGSANKAILYGDYKGLAVNMRENISIEVLREKYATQHALGVVSWFEFDSKVQNNQMLAALVMSVAG